VGNNSTGQPGAEDSGVQCYARRMQGFGLGDEWDTIGPKAAWNSDLCCGQAWTCPARKGCRSCQDRAVHQTGRGLAFGMIAFQGIPSPPLSPRLPTLTNPHPLGPSPTSPCCCAQPRKFAATCQSYAKPASTLATSEAYIPCHPLGENFLQLITSGSLARVLM